jgi:hypothetical protein
MTTKPQTIADRFPYRVVLLCTGDYSIYRGCDFIEKTPDIASGIRRISELYNLERDAMGGQFLP